MAAAGGLVSRPQGAHIRALPRYHPHLMTHDVFVSVGKARTPAQEAFLAALEDVLREEQMNPRVLGRNEFSADDPLAAVCKLVDECRALYQDFGVGELVIKGGELTSHVFAGDTTTTRQAQAVAATDTTGAGDSFNGGYLGGRLTGRSVEDSLQLAQPLSANVVQHRGAIMPADKD